MQILTKKSISAIVAGSALIGTFALAGTALAAGPGWGMGLGGHMGRPGVVGTVASVSGNTITVTSQMWQRPSTTGTAPTPTTTTYTVDGTNATVTKSGAASTLSAILVGDTVMVQGTVTGTNVVATKINDGIFKGRMGHGAPGTAPGTTSGSAPAFTGNGSPVVGGSVTAISGNTLTITAKGGTAYTVDGTSATVQKAGSASTLALVATGDNVIVQGTVNGTSVVASTILDQGTAPAATGTGTSPPRRGFLGGLFSRIFGFF